MDGYHQPQWEQSYNAEGSEYPPYDPPPQYPPVYPPSYPPPYYPPPNYSPHPYYPPYQESYYPPPHDYYSSNSPPYQDSTYEGSYPPYYPDYEESSHLPPQNFPLPLHELQAQEGYDPYATTSTDESSDRYEMLQSILQMCEERNQKLAALEYSLKEMKKKNEQRDQERYLEEQETNKRFDFLERTMEQLAQMVEEKESYVEEEVQMRNYYDYVIL